MASTFIAISNNANPYSQELSQFIRQLQSLVEQSDRLKDRYDQMAAGADWTTLATYLALSTANAETVYNLMASVNTELHATNITLLTDRCG